MKFRKPLSARWLWISLPMRSCAVFMNSSPMGLALNQPEQSGHPVLTQETATIAPGPDPADKA
jgi:hypothetical protein